MRFFLGIEVWVVGLLPGLRALKGDVLLSEQGPEALVCDVFDRPLGDQVESCITSRGLPPEVTQRGDLTHIHPLAKAALSVSPSHHNRTFPRPPENRQQMVGPPRCSAP
jgi:hypothetical protein